VLLVLSVIHRVVSVLCCWQCCSVAGTNVDVLLVLLLVCCVACVVIGVLHCWCWCIALLVLLITFLIMFLSTHLNHSTFGVGVDALLVLLIMFLNACLNNFSLCCSFTVLIYSLNYYSHCMFFGEILPSPSPCKWCVGGPSHCCMSLVIRYPSLPLPFPFLLLVYCIVNVVIVAYSLYWMCHGEVLPLPIPLC
jgi:hypothetical protein